MAKACWPGKEFGSLSSADPREGRELDLRGWETRSPGPSPLLPAKGGCLVCWCPCWQDQFRSDQTRYVEMGCGVPESSLAELTPRLLQVP